MPLVAAKCTSCGANLKVDSTHDAAVCPYCKTPFIVEKAIQKYETNVHVETLQTDVVNILDSNSADNLAKAGDSFIDLGDFKAAEGKFKSMTAEFPYDYRGWWGLVRVHTGDFTLEITDKTELSQINSFAENAQKTCSDPKPLMDQFRPYYEKMKSVKNRLIDKYEKEKQALETAYQQVSEPLQAEIHELEQELQRENSRNPGNALVVILVIIAIAFFIYVIYTAYNNEGIILALIIIVFWGIILLVIVSILGRVIFAVSEKIRQSNVEDLNRQLSDKRKQLNESRQKLKPDIDRCAELLRSMK